MKRQMGPAAYKGLLLFCFVSKGALCIYGCFICAHLQKCNWWKKKIEKDVIFCLPNNKTSGVLGFRRMRLLQPEWKSEKVLPFFPASLFKNKTLSSCLTWEERRRSRADTPGRDVCRLSTSEERHLQEWSLPSLAGRGPGKVIKKGIFFSLRGGLAHGFHANSPFQLKLFKNYKHQVTPGIQTLRGPDFEDFPDQWTRQLVLLTETYALLPWAPEGQSLILN